MSASMVQLVGGHFQDAEGNVLANGYLTLLLSQDASVNDSQICAGVEITIYLDANGDVVNSPGQFVWGNDVLSPVNTYYRVTGYTAEGQTAFGPNNQQIVGTGTFDVGSWLPNSVISWFPSPQPLSLEVNGSPASSQTSQNLVEGSNITITDLGSGSVSIAATFPPPSPPTIPTGTNVADVPWNFWNRGSSTTIPVAGYTYFQVQFANSIHVFPAKWTVSIYVTTPLSAAIGEMCVIRTLKDSLTTVDITPITFGGSPTPLFNSTGTKTSDQISLQIDASHDYYFGFTGNPYGGSGDIASNSGSNSEPLFTSYAGNTNNGGNPVSVSWSSSIGAGGGWAAVSGFPCGYFLTGWNVV